MKLDRVVTSTQGLIATTAGFVYVSPLASGVIRQVNVRAGQIVRKGQPLATLDPTFTHADLAQQQQHYGSVAAAVAREEAELTVSLTGTQAPNPTSQFKAGSGSNVRRNIALISPTTMRRFIALERNLPKLSQTLSNIRNA